MIGGWTGNFSTQVYNVADDSWTTKAPIPYSPVGYHSAVCSGKIYIMGGTVGSLEGGPDVNFVQVYDPKNDSWTFGAPMPEVIQGGYATATTGAMALRRIYLIGGMGQR